MARRPLVSPEDDVEIYEALYTTRSMRRLKPDPIPLDTQARILDAAVRAPSGGNRQLWRFLFVDDPAIRNRLGPIYRDCVRQLWSAPAYADAIERAKENPTDAASIAQLKLTGSAQHLADHFEEVPLLLFAFAKADTSGGSIFPAVWSAMLAARAEGIGTCLTTILGFRQDEVFAILGVPGDQSWGMACCVTMGYPTGSWGVAARQPAHSVAARNRWDEPVGFEIPEPLWTGRS
jgi:nitroreductase